MNKAIFFDLQGTLGGAGTGDIVDFEFYPFSLEALKLASDSEYKVIVVTNQGHINKGEITMDDYHIAKQRLEEYLVKNDACWDSIYCCPHTREQSCNCKKPKTGMIDSAVEDYDIDLKASYILGDMGMNDMVLADNVGAKGILVLTGVGEGSMNEFRHTWEDIEPYYVAANVLDAVNYILK